MESKLIRDNAVVSGIDKYTRTIQHARIGQCNIMPARSKLAHQSFERVALSLNLSLELPSLAQCFVPVYVLAAFQRTQE